MCLISFSPLSTVPPAVPSDVQITNVSSDAAIVSWARTSETTDDAADRITLSLRYLNESIAKELTLGGEVESHRIKNLVPGMSYTVSLAVHNQDGNNNTPLEPFETQPGGMQAACMESVMLLYRCMHCLDSFHV